MDYYSNLAILVVMVDLLLLFPLYSVFRNTLKWTTNKSWLVSLNTVILSFLILLSIISPSGSLEENVAFVLITFCLILVMEILSIVFEDYPQWMLVRWIIRFNPERKSEIMVEALYGLAAFIWSVISIIVISANDWVPGTEGCFAVSLAVTLVISLHWYRKLSQ